ncbi:MAG: hypothetical protein U0893_14720 [Chloroflexota bacterium]
MASRKAPSLAQLIRRSPALDASARRQWLAVLPHLSPDDQARLREILEVTGEPLTPLPSDRGEALTLQPPLPAAGEGEPARE